MKIFKMALPFIAAIFLVVAGCAEEHAVAPPAGGETGGVTEGGPAEETLPPPTATHTLTVNLVSEEFGTGRVDSSPEGIQCPLDCSKGFDQGSTVVLSARPYPDVILKNWEGCTEFVEGKTLFPDCKVVLDSDRTVTATFKRITSTPPPTEPLEPRPRSIVEPRIPRIPPVEPRIDLP